MESEERFSPDALQDIESVRNRVAGMPRGHARLQLSYTLLLAAYMGVLVLSGSTEGGSSVMGGETMALVLAPIIISTGLISGANERFSVRQRTTARYWIAVALFVVALTVLLIWGVIGNGYPWWLSLIYAAVSLVVFGVRPLRALMRAPKGTRRQEARKLTGHPFIVTVGIGALFGALCVAIITPVGAPIVMLVGLVATIVALSAQRASWGLLRTGYEWRLTQWIGFGIAATLMFFLAVLLMTTDFVTPVIAIVTGVAVAVILIGSAFVGRRAHGTPTS